ncbi:MAG: hypothetical protein Q8904_10780 [Bacteroidota bacterium]|nr:hypothetical protein [Bacteroidota bacterium]
MKKQQPSQILFITAGTITILGVFARFFNINYAPYIFSVGAALLIFIQGKYALDNKHAEKRQKRLARIGFLNSLMLGLGAYFMFTGSNSWAVMVLIYALSSFFYSFRGN